MYSSVYVACLLAAYALASPAQVQPRGFYPSIGGGGFQSASSESQQASSSSQSSISGGVGGIGGLGGLGGGFGVSGLAGIGGGIGGGGFSQSSHYESSSSSSSSVISSFGGLGSQIAQMQSMLASGAMTQQIAYQSMAQLASSFQNTLGLAPGCGACFGQSGFSTAASGVFNQFTQLMTSMQARFGSSFNQICAPFGGLQSSFRTFFQSASSNGLALNSILPSSFPGVIGNIMPGIGPEISSLGFK